MMIKRGSDGEKEHLIARSATPHPHNNKTQQQQQTEHNGTEETPWYLCAPEVDAEDPGVVVPGGLSICKAAIFIMAQMAGSGILALPNALAGTGWTGIGLLMVLGLLALYCGTILGKCWNLVRAKHEIPTHARDPYPLIGYHSFGKSGKYLVEVCILLTLIGSSVVYLILSAKQISTVLDVKIGSFSEHTEFRIWILICGGFLIPCTWFASPKEMWLVAYGATLCSFSACCLIIVQSALLIQKYGFADDSKYTSPTVTSFFNSFGSIAFSYGGGVLLPTLQSDMKKPSRFIYAAILGFMGIFALYLPCTILPYLAAGSDIDPNVLRTLESFPGSDRNLVKIAETLMTFHLLFAIVILSNPTSQLLEEKLGIPHSKFDNFRYSINSHTILINHITSITLSGGKVGGQVTYISFTFLEYKYVSGKI